MPGNELLVENFAIIFVLSEYGSLLWEVFLILAGALILIRHKTPVA